MRAQLGPCPAALGAEARLPPEQARHRKAQYQLPAYIADTGIATMKDALKEKEAESTLKQRTRERVQPKMGKMDIDYQKLYDAFFKFQSKPHLSAYGDTTTKAKSTRLSTRTSDPVS